MAEEGRIEEGRITDLAELFKVFGDSTRLRIMLLLSERENMSVGEIAAGLDMTASAISHQLRILKNIHLVKNIRDGKSILYSLDDDHVSTIIKQGLDHVSEGH